jgi:tetratricopeptide (TPR) repeat protein
MILALGYQSLGKYLGNTGRYQEAEQVLRRALDAWAGLPDARRTEPALLRAEAFLASDIGRTYQLMFRWAEAEPHFRRCVALLQELSSDPTLGSPHDLGLVLYDHATVLQKLGRMEEAITCLRKSADVLDKLAATYPAVPQYQLEAVHHRQILGVFLRWVGRRDEAEPLLRRAVEVLQQPSPALEAAPHFHFKRLLIQFDWAWALYVWGQADEAERVFDKALTAAGQLVAANPENVAHRGLLAHMTALCPHPRSWDAGRAVAACRRAAELLPTNWYYWNLLGVALYRAGDLRGAAEAFAKGAELSPYTGEHGFYFAMTQWRLGAPDEARKWYGKAVAWMQTERPGDPEQLRLRDEAAKLLGVSDAANPPVGPRPDP